MRLLKLYVVYDSKAQTLIGPVVHDHSAVPIIRQITEAVNKPGTLIANNPDDFKILNIGMIDEETGVLYDRNGENAVDAPEIITSALALKAAEA